jgi:hypothetical protein
VVERAADVSALNRQAPPATGRFLRVALHPRDGRADLSGYRVAAAFDRVVSADGDADRLTVADVSTVTLENSNIADLAIPTAEALASDITVTIAAPHGTVLQTRSVAPEEADRPVEVEVEPADYSAPQRTDDPAFGRPARVRGRVIDAGGRTSIGVKQVVLWGTTAGGEPLPLLAVETDQAGYFSGAYPIGEFTQASGTVALGNGHTVKEPLRLNDDGSYPEVVLLVVDLPHKESADSDDCGCPSTAPVRRNPDAQDLTTAPESFSTDLGGRCVDFTVPDRTLEEFAFSYVVRTTEPDIRGVGLDEDPTVPLETLLVSFPQPLLKKLDPRLMVRPDAPTNAVDGGAASGRGDGVLGEELPPQLERAIRGRMVSAKLAKSLLADPNAQPDLQIAEAVRLSAHRQLITQLNRVTATPPQRAPLTQQRPVDWDDDPTVYQAVSVAHGHLLRFKQEWVADGYSLGDLLYSLPLAPAQRKMIAIVDWERREEAERGEELTATEAMGASLQRDRDITDIVNGSLEEHASGGSRARSSSFGGGGALGFIGSGAAGLLGVGGATSSASSSSWQDSSRSTSAYALNQLRDRTLQSASAVRGQRSSVVQSVRQGERVTAQTEIVANYNHCHAMTVQYFQVLRHLLVRQRLVDVQECLFIPLLMSPFTPTKVVRWGSTLRPLLPPALRGGIEATERIQANYVGSDLPTGSYADEALEELDGELYLRFQLARPKDTNDDFDPNTWGPVARLLRITTKEFYDAYLRNQAQKDRIFLDQLGRRIAVAITDKLRISAVLDNQDTVLPLDCTLLSTFANDVPLYVSVRMDAATLPPLTRRNIRQLKIETDTGEEVSAFLPEGSRIIVERATFTYRTAHYQDTLVANTAVRNDLTGNDPVRISTRVTNRELRNPRNDDKEASRLLLAHLNEHTEQYHAGLWASMSPARRYMLLDGFTAPNSGGRSLASVVDNELIGIVGNCLVMPVSRGYHLDPTYRQDAKNPVNLLEHYQPNTPIEPMRVAIPTRGVYAEAVMGSCNSCEFKEEERFWRWDEAPPPDQLPAIQPLSTDSRRSEPGDLQPKDLPTPIIAMQSAPAAPDPTGLAQMFGLLSRSDLFRDMAGLAGTQQNAAAALQAALNTAQFFGGKAADLAMQGRMARDIDKSMRAIQNARSAGLLSNEQARELSQSAIRGMIGEARPAGSEALTMEPDVQRLLQAAALGRSGEVSIHRNGETVDIKRPGSSTSTGSPQPGSDGDLSGTEGGGPGGIVGSVLSTVLGQTGGDAGHLQLPPPRLSLKDRAFDLGKDAALLESYKRFQGDQWFPDNQPRQNWYWSTNAKLPGSVSKPADLPSTSAAWNSLGSRAKMILGSLGGFDANALNPNAAGLAKVRTGYENWPEGHFAIIQGGGTEPTNTCNIYVGEALFRDGLDIRRSDGKYYSAKEIWKGLPVQLMRVESIDVAEGDIAAWGGHVEIVTHVDHSTKVFCTVGGYRANPPMGTPKCGDTAPTTHTLNVANLRFYRPRI